MFIFKKTKKEYWLPSFRLGIIISIIQNILEQLKKWRRAWDEEVNKKWGKIQQGFNKYRMSEANVILSLEKITDFPDKWTAAGLIYLEHNAAFECSVSQEFNMSASY